MDRIVPRHPIELTLKHLRPVIHLAHRLRLAVNVPDRVIFDHELVLVLGGEGEIEVAAHRQRVTPGDLFVIPPFVPHRLVSDSPNFEHVAIHFDLTLGFLPGGDLRRRAPYQIRFTEGHDLEKHVKLVATDPRRGKLERLVQLWAEHSALDTLQAEALLMSVVCQLLRTPERPLSPQVPAVDSRIAGVLRQLELQFRNPFRIPDLAAAAGLGVSQFNRLFRECTSETPAAYIRRLRLSEARTLVETSDEPMKVIAFASGFSNPAHFSRAFYGLHGCWPTELRRRVRT